MTGYEIGLHAHTTLIISCLDINECAEGSDECDEHCYNTIGSYSCNCTEPGYQLHSDGTTCQGQYIFMTSLEHLSHTYFEAHFLVSLLFGLFEVISNNIATFNSQLNQGCQHILI